MSHEITADWTTLMGQASSTASVYFAEALKTLRSHLLDDGEIEELDLADRLKLAALAISLAKIAAHDFHGSAIGVASQKISGSLDEISNSIDYVCASMDERRK